MCVRSTLEIGLSHAHRYPHIHMLLHGEVCGTAGRRHLPKDSVPKLYRHKDTSWEPFLVPTSIRPLLLISISWVGMEGSGS